MSEFVKRLQFSGYNKRFRFEIVNSAINAYNVIKQQVNEGKRPMYRKMSWKRNERRNKKRDKKTNWYEKGGYDAAMFVPATPKSTLAKVYRDKIKESGIKIKVVERRLKACFKSMIHCQTRSAAKKITVLCVSLV